MISRTHRLRLQQLASVEVSSAGQIVELEIAAARAQDPGVKEVYLTDLDRFVFGVLYAQPFADD